jgi:DnaJ like chaperone protein
MKKFGKWIGAGLGWTIGGPIGAIVGFAFGSFVDSSDLEKFSDKNAETTTGDFVISLLILIAAVMKADKRVLRSELTFVRNYLIRSFGEDEIAEMLRILRDVLKKEFVIADVTAQIRSRMDYASRMQLMHLVFGIALSDGEIASPEIRYIEEIGAGLGISEADLLSLRSMFIKTADWAYKVLETDRTASDEDIKRKYRQLALKNHPDKVAYLGEQIRLQAQDKFQKIQEAWEAIKKERGIV